MKLFGATIKEAREKLKKNNDGYSLRKLADKAGISPTFLSLIENGKMTPPAPDTIIRISRLLNLDADETLALAGKTDPALKKIINEHPKETANLLKQLSGLSKKQLDKIIEYAQKIKK